MRMTIMMIIALVLISAMADAYILCDIHTFVKKKCRKLTNCIYICGMVIWWAALIVAICLPKRSGSQSLLPVMWLLYCLISILVPKIIYVIFSLIGRLINCFIKKSPDNKRRNYGAFVGIPLSLITFVLMWWGVFFTRYDIEINKVDIESAKVPAAFNDYKIVQFSDAHVGTWGNDTTFISKLVNTINSMNPDMIVFTGDIVNRETSELEPFVHVLSRLKAPDGVYSIMGNHDYGDYMDWEFPSQRETNIALLQAWQRQMGWKMLNNEHAVITHDGDSIVLIGVENWGEPPFHQYGKITDAYPLSKDSDYNLNDKRFKILLTHNPEHWVREVSKISNIDLSLSGHTHAMQMMAKIGNWKWSPSVFKYKTWGGLYQNPKENGENQQLYVNIGVGEVGFPARLGGAYPEITELTLKRTPAN